MNNYTLYNPIENSTIGKLSKFKPLSTDKIRKLVRKMQIKSCGLDYLPTHIFKKHMDSFIPNFTKIVNLSLKSGVFSEDWKTAILRPLLKKKVVWTLLTQIIGLLAIFLFFLNLWSKQL